MQNIKFKYCLPLFVLMVFTTSCEDYLDQEPRTTITEALFFQTPDQFELAANFLYTRVGFEDGDISSDLSNNIQTPDVAYSTGLKVPSTDDAIYTDNYADLRAVNELIQKASEYTGESREIATSAGTAYFFRAWHHYKLLLRFGGVIIVTEPLELTRDDQRVVGPRNSRYEVVFQMLADLDLAIENLPDADDLSEADRGKLSAEAAKAFKARILLYEATWERYVGTSTDGDGVTSGAGSNKPTDYLTIDAMLEEAVTLSEEVMNAGTHELWNHREENDLGKDHLFYLFNLEDGGGNPMGYSKADNNEFIWERVYDFNLGSINEGHTQAKRYGPSRKMMDMYLCSDGLPVQHSAVFNGYDSLLTEYENRDDRLHLGTKTPLERYWGFGGARLGGGAQYDLGFDGVNANWDFRHFPHLFTLLLRNNGYEGRKYVSEHPGREEGQQSFNYPLIRLAEVYLIFAEAAYELDDNISNSDLDRSINRIRERSGVAPLSNELIAPFSDLTMLGEIRRERAIELFGEGFRYDDLKRWNIASEELNKAVCVNYINSDIEALVDPVDNVPSYNPDIWNLTTGEINVSSYGGFATTKAGAVILQPQGVRNFTLSNYLDNIPLNEINQNQELQQNPGW